jgi:hypothetical protein
MAIFQKNVPGRRERTGCYSPVVASPAPCPAALAGPGPPWRGRQDISSEKGTACANNITTGWITGILPSAGHAFLLGSQVNDHEDDASTAAVCPNCGLPQCGRRPPRSVNGTRAASCGSPEAEACALLQSDRNKHHHRLATKSQMGHERHFRATTAMSPMPPTTEVGVATRDRRSVP